MTGFIENTRITVPMYDRRFAFHRFSPYLMVYAYDIFCTETVSNRVTTLIMQRVAAVEEVIDRAVLITTSSKMTRFLATKNPVAVESRRQIILHTISH
jgi:hypothetical protein